MSAETRDAWVEEKDAKSNRKSGSVLSVPCFKIELILIILYGTVIIEYKAPKKLDTVSEFVKAKEQIIEYIKEEAGGKPENFGKFFGVILDGYKISFVRFRRNQWVADEPTELSEESVYRLLEAIISLKRKAIDADFLLTDFGPESETSEKVISVLYEALVNSKSSRTEMLFRDWKRVFS